MSEELARYDADRYSNQAKLPLNCLLFLLPLLVFFHVGTAYYGADSLLASRDLRRLLGFFGATAAYLPAVLVAAVLVGQALIRRDRFKAQPWVAVGIAAESLAWMLPLVALNLLAGRAMLQAGNAGYVPVDPSTMRGLLSAVGAGIYEEFIFRLVLVGFAAALLCRLFALKRPVVSICFVLAAAIAFSLYHLSPHQVRHAGFPLFDFSFRALAGVYLGWLFLLRGFGIAVGAHAAYDIYVELATRL